MGEKNNTIKFGVPGVFGCSHVLECSGVSGRSGVFRCSGVPGVFQCSGVPVFRVLVHAQYTC